MLSCLSWWTELLSCWDSVLFNFIVKYDILISEEEEKEVEEMCNLSLGLRMEAMQEGLAKGKIEGKIEGLAEGKLESTIQHVKSLMEELPNLDVYKAMDLLKVEENLREQVLKALQ